MKFTNGYWRIREEIDPVYAVEYYDADYSTNYDTVYDTGKKDNSLVVYAATKHMGDRGDTLNQPMLTVTFSSPMNWPNSFFSPLRTTSSFSRRIPWESSM